ncbi:MAG: hypothetical protein EVA73_01120 [Limisphaerales bacterium]|nr:MAG: hypothetical protein EVA73_01120 [Limisphaerales bacterium]
MPNRSSKSGHGFKEGPAWQVRTLEICNKICDGIPWFFLVFFSVCIVLCIGASIYFGTPQAICCMVPVIFVLMWTICADQILHLKRLWVAKRAVSKTFPPHLKKILKTEVKIYQRLPERLRAELERKMMQFLESIPFKFKISCDEVMMERARVCVAAEACLLVVHRDFAGYRWLKEVEICQRIEGAAGQATRSQVRLEWNEVKRGLADCTDGYSVTMHEFAHILDTADDGRAQSNPFPKDSPEFSRWKEMLDLEFDRLWLAHESGKKSVLRPYALKIKSEYEGPQRGNPKIRPEFFTCATEVFFEKPKELQDEFPKLFDLMREFYRVDPADW